MTPTVAFLLTQHGNSETH